MQGSAEKERVFLGQHVDAALHLLAEDGYWPAVVHEVEPALVEEERKHFLWARLFRVVREVPPSEVFGPGAEAFVTLLNQLRTFPWLSPRSTPDETYVAEKVERHYVALGSYSAAAPVPVRIIKTWAEATNATTIAGREHSRRESAGEAYRALVGAIDESPIAVERPNAANLALSAPEKLADTDAWHAAWHAASAELLGTLATTDDVERVGQRIDAGRDTCLGVTRFSRPVVEHGVLRYTNAPELANLMEEFGTEIGPLATAAWAFASAASHVASRAAEHILVLPTHPNPWLPLVELFRVGAWPIGEVDGRFVVLCPAERHGGFACAASAR